jgi:hypothetical protein
MINRTLLAAAAMAMLMTGTAYAYELPPAVECRHFLDKPDRAGFEACMIAQGVSEQEADMAATFLIQHKRNLDRVSNELFGFGYSVYRPDGKLVGRPNYLSTIEQKCVDDDFATADVCLENLGWRFIAKPQQDTAQGK